jgi:hypothetical protein
LFFFCSILSLAENKTFLLVIINTGGSGFPGRLMNGPVLENPDGEDRKDFNFNQK